MKRAAVISLTECGRQLSAKIANAALPFRMQRYCFYKHSDPDAQPFDDLSSLTAQLFIDYDALIFLAACGIAVRMIAPHIQSKLHDPAVIVSDHAGQFVIPLLSGHIGGANTLAKQIAEITGGTAVITTATDSGRLFSPDCFASENHLILTDMKAAKAIAAAVIDGEQIGFQSELPYDSLPVPLTDSEQASCGLYVGSDRYVHPFPMTLHLVPQNLIIGIGCKKGTPEETIREAVSRVMQNNQIDFSRIRAVASIDLKANEPGILDFCRKNHLPYYTYSAVKLMDLSGEFTASPFVEHVTGADNICERSAVLCSGGKLVIKKQAYRGVTVACAEMTIKLTFERDQP